MVLDTLIQEFSDRMVDSLADRLTEKLAAKLKPEIVGSIESAGISDSDKYFNYGETCKMLGISRPTLKKRIREGLISPVFDGTKTPRFRLSDIRAAQQQYAI